MFEESENLFKPYTGKVKPIRVFVTLARRIPGTPSSIHSFQVIIDRLFRHAGLGNWLSHVFGAASRTTIAGPAE
jgi:hypothetical protein